MLSRRLLAAARGGSFSPPPLPTDYVGLINAAASTSYNYTIGPITSSDGGATWTAGTAAILSAGAGGAWDDGYVKDPALAWDGSQFVMYFAGYDGANFRIGRATASTLTGTWTKYGSNPVIGFGGAGSFDEDGAEFPVVLYEPDDTGREWKMWYAAYPNGATPGNPTGMTTGYAYSSDGLSWTKHGEVLSEGAAAAFDEKGTCPGAVIKVGSTYTLFYGGWNSTLKMRTGYATFTDPEGTYTKGGQITGYTGNLSVGGWTWQSNLPRSIVARGSSYRVFGTLWNPTPVDTEEVSFTVEASDLTTWPTPSGLMIPVNDGSWHANSAENPSVIVAP